MAFRYNQSAYAGVAQLFTVSSDTAMSDDMGALMFYNLSMHYVYFLFMANGQVYTGSSSNLRKRVSDHKRGNVKTTSKYLPVKLLGYESYAEKSDAQRREKYLKSTEGKRLFRQQYRDVLANH